MLTTRARMAVLGTLLTLLVACGGGGDDDAGGADGGDAGGGDDAVFVEITTFGGFVPVGADFASPPAVVVFDDGRMMTPGAVPAIFPGPAVMPLTEGRIDADTLAQLVDLAGEAGLLGDVPPDYGEAAVIDAATTRVRVVVDGESHVIEVVSPEFTDDPQFSEDQRANRRRLAGFIQGVTSAATEGETGIYDPEGYRVSPYVPSEGDPAVPANELAWPFATPLAENECQAIEGDDVAAFEELLATATQITHWTSDGETWQLAIRPLLPHESGCP